MAPARSGIREHYGLRPIINVCGTMTALGASIVVPEAVSAVAALLELAAWVGPRLSSGGPYRARLQLAAYDLEEFGLVGEERFELFARGWQTDQIEHHAAQPDAFVGRRLRRERSLRARRRVRDRNVLPSSCAGRRPCGCRRSG